jgi:putative polymerase
MTVLILPQTVAGRSADGLRLRRVAMVAIVLAATTFNFVLCFVNTSLLHVSSAGVVLCEIALVGMALLAIIDRSKLVVALLAGCVLYWVFIATVQGAFDPKPLRDMVIPLVFYAAGRALGTPRDADRLVAAAVAVVLAVGVFEFLFLPLYIHYFDVLGYYVSRGTVSASQAEVASDRLFVSGMRYEGRTLLPFLGEHRASSVFLEPVSVGNFGAIAWAWVLLRNWGRPLATALKLTPILAIFVLADARFGLMISLATTVAYVGARHVRWPVLLLAPFLVIVALALVGYAYPDLPWDNTLRGRLLLSGQFLQKLTIPDVFALVRVGGFLSDSGYAYTLTQIGLVGFALLWSAFVLAPCHSLAAWRYRLFAALYVVALLTISDSIYSIKTAALLWFLLGVLAYPARASQASGRA